MGEDNTFKFAIDQLEQSGRDLLEFAEKNPVVFSLGAITIAAGVATIVVPIAVGFGAAGPIAGSLAAAWMSSIGSVAAGSFFAMLQSLTMSGTLLAVGGGMIGVGVAGLLGGEACMKHLEGVAKNTDWKNGDPKGLEWVKGDEWLNKAMGEAGKQVEDIGEKTNKGCEDLGKQIQEGGEKLGQDIGNGCQEGIENMQKGGEEFVAGIQSAFGG